MKKGLAPSLDDGIIGASRFLYAIFIGNHLYTVYVSKASHICIYQDCTKIKCALKMMGKKKIEN